MNSLLRHLVPFTTLGLLVDLLWPGTWFESVASQPTESDLHLHMQRSLISFLQVSKPGNTVEKYSSLFLSAMRMIRSSLPARQLFSLPRSNMLLKELVVTFSTFRDFTPASFFPLKADFRYKLLMDSTSSPHFPPASSHLCSPVPLRCPEHRPSLLTLQPPSHSARLA